MELEVKDEDDSLDTFSEEKVQDSLSNSNSVSDENVVEVSSVEEETEEITSDSSVEEETEEITTDSSVEEETEEITSDSSVEEETEEIMSDLFGEDDLSVGSIFMTADSSDVDVSVRLDNIFLSNLYLGFIITVFFVYVFISNCIRRK